MELIMTDNKHENILTNQQYGKWNAILVTHNNLPKYVFYQNHSKMFPETLDNWVNAIRKINYTNQISPVRMDIDITNTCPNDCIMCFAKELRTNNKVMIPLDKLVLIFDDFKQMGGISVRLTGGGDPLAHPNIIGVINHLSNLNLKITIETNGDCLSNEIIDTIVQHVHHLRISINAGDNISREQVHRPMARHFSYDTLLQKIRLVRDNSIKLGNSEKLFIGATFVILPENFSVAGKFISDMYDIGINWVALRKNIYREIYEQHPDIIPFVEKEIANFKKEISNHNKEFTIEEQYGVSFSPKSDFENCLISHARLIILADSSLQLCCLTRNGLVPHANMGILDNSSNPIQRLLKDNESLDDFKSKVPNTCQLCIDRDNNISLSNIASLVAINKDFQFSKANVCLNSIDNTLPPKLKITQIILDNKKYQLFQHGGIVEL
jgi:MoaA/NifB/PqqE/SkfB family radical SAM enzyme